MGPYDDEKLGLHKAAQFYYYPGWWEPGPTLEVQFNLERWNELPPFYQEVVKTAAFEANMTMLARYDARNNTALQSLVSQGVELRAYSQEILTAAEEASFALYDELAAADPDFKALFDEWKIFRDGINAWHNINEHGYTRYIDSTLG